MRWSLLLLLVAIPRLAFGEPKVAVAPLDDDDGKVAEIVAEVAADRAKVTKPGRVEGAMKSMGVSVLSPKSLKKLRAKLDVDVVIYGSVEKENGTKRVSLTFAGSSKTKPKLDVEAKNPKTLRKELEAKLAKRIAAAMEGDGGDEEDEEAEDARREEMRREEERKREEERRKQQEEEERKREEDKRAEKKRRDEEEARKRDDEDRRRKKRKNDDEDDEERTADRKKDRKQDRDDDDEDRKDRKKRIADRDEDDEDDDGRTRKRLGDDDDTGDEDEDKPRKKKRKHRRHVLTQNALWLDGGGAVARRTLTYASTGMMRPPPVGTAAAAGRLEGEVYPGAFSSLKGAAAGIGASAVLGYTFGLGIAVPGTTVTTPIKNGHFAIGARYRFVFGEHSISPGISYWRRYYMADRSGLMNPDQLDMPDVDYKAIAPGVIAHIAVTPKIAAFGSLDIPLMLNSGPIQEPASYGSAKILAFDFRGGAQIMVAQHAALQIAAEFLQVGLSFTGQAGSKASTRMVQSATDRSIGISATIGITY